MKKAILLVVMVMFFGNVSMAGAGDYFNATWIRAGESIVNNAARENTRMQQEQQRTIREAISRDRQFQIEQEHHARDVAIQQIRSAEAVEKARIQKEERIALEKERSDRAIAIQQTKTDETISREKIKERRDVSVEAIKAKDGKSVIYQQGGKTVSIDIQALADENQKLKAEIENLQLQLKMQQLQNQISKR